MRPALPRLIVLMLIGTIAATLARGQVSSDEAYRRLREREEQRKRAAAAAATQPGTTRPADPTPGATRRPAAVPPATRPTTVAARRVAERWTVPDTQVQAFPLLAARAKFQTTLRPDAPALSDYHEPPQPPPKGVFDLVRFPAPLGQLAAYVTPDPRDGKRRPAVLWLHGGYSGAGGYLWAENRAENDQSPAAFRDAGFVIMAPNRRGEADGPGKIEMFYGEVDDTLAAIEYLAGLPYVDPARIYLVGHSTGGTLALLTAECTDRVRAAVSLGGVSDIRLILREENHHRAPFDWNNPDEARLRSATDWVDGLRTPTWYFEGDEGNNDFTALQMDRRGQRSKAPFHALVFKGKRADHFSIIRPITRLLAAKMKADTGPTGAIAVTPAEAAEAFNREFSPQPPIRCIPAGAPSIELTDAAKDAFLASIRRIADPATVMFRVFRGDDGQVHTAYSTDEFPLGYVTESKGVRIFVDDELAAEWGPTVIDYKWDNPKSPYVIKPKPAAAPATKP